MIKTQDVRDDTTTSGLLPNPSTWGLISNHGRTLLCIARDPDVRLRDIAAFTDLTERAVFSLVDDLVRAGIIEKLRTGRRNSYIITPGQRVPEAPHCMISELVGLLTSER